MERRDTFNASNFTFCVSKLTGYEHPSFQPDFFFLRTVLIYTKILTRTAMFVN